MSHPTVPSEPAPEPPVPAPSSSGRPLDQPHPSRLSPSHPRRADILAAHRSAMEEGSPGYADPETGLFVMTAAHLLSRSACCQSGCRHCPYLV